MVLLQVCLLFLKNCCVKNTIALFVLLLFMKAYHTIDKYVVLLLVFYININYELFHLEALISLHSSESFIAWPWAMFLWL